MSNIIHYELTAIIDSNIPDSDHQGIIDTVKKLITENEGEISSESNLGRKKLSYPIKNSLKGVFICFEFDIEPKAIKLMEKELKLNKNIIRYLIIKKPKNVTTINSEIEESCETKVETEIKKSQKFEKTTNDNEIKMNDSENIEEEKEETIAEETTDTKDNNEDSDKNLNELDEKLDKILNDEIIN